MIIKLCRYVDNIKLLVQVEFQTIRTARRKNIKYSKMTKNIKKYQNCSDFHAPATWKVNKIHL